MADPSSIDLSNPWFKPSYHLTDVNSKYSTDVVHWEYLFSSIKNTGSTSMRTKENSRMINATDGNTKISLFLKPGSLMKSISFKIALSYSDNNYMTFNARGKKKGLLSYRCAFD